jgi:hypothetical protein
VCGAFEARSVICDRCILSVSSLPDMRLLSLKR